MFYNVLTGPVPGAVVNNRRGVAGPDRWTVRGDSSRTLGGEAAPQSGGCRPQSVTCCYRQP